MQAQSAWSSRHVDPLSYYESTRDGSNGCWKPPTIVFSDVALADAWVAENPALAHMKEEYIMAREALQAEQALNLHLLSQAFLHKSLTSEACVEDEEDVSTQAGTGIAESLTNPQSLFAAPQSLSEVPPLWSRPPVAIGEVPDRVTIIVNPMTAKGVRSAHQALASATKLLKTNGVSVTPLMTTHAGHERDLAQYALDRTILILGGMGTVREVLNGVMARPDHRLVRIGILPNGSLAPYSVEEGVRHVLAGEVREMDVLLVERLAEVRNGQQETTVLDHCYAFNWGCWGSAAEALHLYNKRLKFMRMRGLRLSGLTQFIKNRWYRARLEFVRGELPDDMHDRFDVVDDYTALNFFNHRASNGILLAPRAQLDDGFLDLHIVKAGTRKDLNRYFDVATYSGSNWLDATQPCPSKSRSMNLEYIQASSITVWPDAESPNVYQGPETVVVDGDTVAGSPFRVSVVPLAIRIFASHDFYM